MEIKKREDIPENRQVRLTVTVDRSTWQDALMHCYNGIKSLCPVEGEPTREKIEAAYGPDFLYQEAVNETYPQALVEAIGREDIAIAGTPTLTVESIGSDGFTFTALIDLYPEVKLGQYKGLSAVYPAAELSEEDTQAALEEYARAHMTVEHPDRAAMGDEVVLDFEGFVDGKPFDGGKAEGYTLTLGSGAFIPGFEDQLVGLKAGEEKAVEVTFPESYTKELAGKAVVFKIKLHDVCVRQLPSMNSDFAKKVGGVDTMEEFREKVRKQLYDGRHGGALNHAKDQVLAKLADAAEGELPSVLVESTYQQEMQNVQQQLQMQRMTLNSYLSQIHETRESFTAKLHAGAEKNTRARMALLQIAQQENLVPTDEEIDKMIAERAERTKKTVEEIREKTNIPALKRTEAIRRAADWVIERSTIEEK